MSFRIASVSAWVTVDESGEEGILGVCGADGRWMPLIGADETRLRDLEEVARRVGASVGKTVYLLKFSVREEVKRIMPPAPHLRVER